MANRVLLVEDDAPLARVIGDNLRIEGYEVAVTRDVGDAVTRSRTFLPDLVLLDVMLPSHKGLELCSVLRQGGRVPVIMVSGRVQKAEKIRALRVAVDDYLTKPLDVDELLARVHAVLRRSRRAVDRITLNEVVIDLGAMTARTGSRELRLTHREFEILRYLAERQDRVVYRNELLRELWGYVDVPLTTRSVDHAIVRLRKKLESDPHHPRFIRTVHGDGYRLSVTQLSST
jgi:DNA-binding response OmpR family regulator